MRKRYRTKAELESKVIRVSLGQYALLSEISRRAGVSISGALDLALERQEPEPEREPEKIARVSPIQIPMIGVRVLPGQVTSRIMPGRVTEAARVMPGRVTGNGVGHIRPKIIKGVS